VSIPVEAVPAKTEIRQLVAMKALKKWSSDRRRCDARVYKTRALAGAHVFDYIEVFENRTRRDTFVFLDRFSPGTTSASGSASIMDAGRPP
jgi:hypothetical protein